MARYQLIVIFAALAPWVLQGALRLWVRQRGVASLRLLLPAITILCWAAWLGIVTVYLFQIYTGRFRRYFFVAYAVYAGIGILYSWARKTTMFETLRSTVSPRISAAVLRVPAETYAAVRNPNVVAEWYVERLGMRKLASAPPGMIGLRFDADGASLTLEPYDEFYERPSVVLYTSKIQEAKRELTSRGVAIGTIQRDRQGTRYFEIRDTEGNLIEVSEEPAGGLGGEIL